MTRQVCIAATLAALVCVGGCRKEEAAGTAELTPEQLLDSIRTTVTESSESGNLDAARTALKAGFGNPKLEAYKADLFRELMLLELDAGATNAAVELHLQHVADGQLCGVGFNILGEAFTRSGDQAGLLAWARTLLNDQVPGWVQQRVWSVIINDLAEKEQLAELPGRLDEMLDVPPDVQRAVLVTAARALLSAQDYDSLETLIAAVEPRQETLPWVAPFVVETRLDLLLAKGQLDAAAAFVLKQGKPIPDAALWQRVGKLVAGLDRTDAAACDTFVHAAFSRLQDHPTTLGRVAVQWVAAAAEKKQPGLFVSRMNTVLGSSAIAPGMKARCFNRTFYEIAQVCTDEQKLELGQQADTIYALEGLSKREREAMALVRLDTAFYTQDWRRALDIVSEGMPGKDEAWHSELKNKVGAHLALSEGRYEDAIAGFRKHMEVVAAWEEDVPNPEANTMMSKEAVLGFNEKRIGDIYLKMGGRTADAEKAYERARTHYQAALDTLAPDSKAYELAAAELAAVPESAEAAPKETP